MIGIIPNPFGGLWALKYCLDHLLGPWALRALRAKNHDFQKLILTLNWVFQTFGMMTGIIPNHFGSLRALKYCLGHLLGPWALRALRAKNHDFQKLILTRNWVF